MIIWMKLNAKIALITLIYWALAIRSTFFKRIKMSRRREMKHMGLSSAGTSYTYLLKSKEERQFLNSLVSTPNISSCSHSRRLDPFTRRERTAVDSPSSLKRTAKLSISRSLVSNSSPWATVIIELMVNHQLLSLLKAKRS